jgi:hypothetical protein
MPPLTTHRWMWRMYSNPNPHGKIFSIYIEVSMGGGKGKKDVNAKLTANFINILKYKTNHL